MHDCRKVARRRCGFDEGAGIGAVPEDRAIGKECRVGHEHDIRIRLAELREIRDGQRAAFRQDQIQHDDIECRRFKPLKRVGTGADMLHIRMQTLKMPLPQLSEVLVALDDQDAHFHSVCWDH